MHKQTNAATTRANRSVAETIATTYARDSTDTRVVVVDGYGVSLAVERGHLVVCDGLGRHRRTRTYPRIERTLRRIVVLARNGSITLDALRWCTDVGVSVVTIDADTSSVLAASGAQSHDDARLRRAQAFATVNGVGVDIARYLLLRKLRGQMSILADRFGDAEALRRVENLTTQLVYCATVDTCRGLEGRAAADYFAAWSGLVTGFPTRDMSKVPAHWLRFGHRLSNATSPAARFATTPVNALLNYGYAVAEAECRIACQALGLDPGLGILHADRNNRDSMALDLLEAVRPTIDRYVIELAEGGSLHSSNFHETRRGQCRILAPLTHRVAEQSYLWAKAIAPVAEHVAHMITNSTDAPIANRTPLTRANAANGVRRNRVPVAEDKPDVPTDAPAVGRLVGGRPACAQCGRHEQRLMDGLCSWCSRSLQMRRAWRTRRQG